jgi:hypothetical protein
MEEGYALSTLHRRHHKVTRRREITPSTIIFKTPPDQGLKISERSGKSMKQLVTASLPSYFDLSLLDIRVRGVERIKRGLCQSSDRSMEGNVCRLGFHPTSMFICSDIDSRIDRNPQACDP